MDRQKIDRETLIEFSRLVVNIGHEAADALISPGTRSNCATLEWWYSLDLGVYLADWRRKAAPTSN